MRTDTFAYTLVNTHEHNSIQYFSHKSNSFISNLRLAVVVFVVAVVVFRFVAVVRFAVVVKKKSISGQLGLLLLKPLKYSAKQT